jgi:hypothetical protein
MIARSTLAVHGPLAIRMQRLAAARQGNIGREILTLPLVAARLAGGFIAPVSLSFFSVTAICQGRSDCSRISRRKWRGRCSRTFRSEYSNGLAANRTSFAPETRNECDRTRTKAQQNQRTRPLSRRS